jgi:hypothetical protein
MDKESRLADKLGMVKDLGSLLVTQFFSVLVMAGQKVLVYAKL